MKQKTVVVLGIIGTLGVGVGIIFPTYVMGKKVESTPPKITQTQLVKTVATNTVLSPVDTVKDVDTVSSKLTDKSDPIAIIKNLESQGLVTDNYVKEDIASNGWSNLVKHGVTVAFIDSLTVENQGAVKDNPNIYYVRTNEIDVYTLTGGKTIKAKQKNDWKLIKNSNGQWEIDDVHNLLEKQLS